MPLPPLSTVNGTGTTLLGLHPGADGTFYATAWDVRAYFPVRPRSRHRLRLGVAGTRVNTLGTQLRVASTHEIELIEDTPIEPAEIWRTRFFGWVVAPVVVLAPLLSVLLTWGVLADLSVANGYKATQVPAGALVAALVWGSLARMAIADRLRKALDRLPRA